jgi:surface-adhesin protein E
MRCIVLAACVFACTAPSAFAAKWTPLRSSATAALSVDEASVSRRGDQVRLSYMVDFARPQQDRLHQLAYRSIVTSATLRCKARTVSLGKSELYTGPKASGVLIATTDPTNRETAYTAVEKDTSDEDLWRHACEKKAQAKKP